MSLRSDSALLLMGPPKTVLTVNPALKPSNALSGLPVVRSAECCNECPLYVSRIIASLERRLKGGTETSSQIGTKLRDWASGQA